jgi:metallo-beta-lactamase class B
VNWKYLPSTLAVLAAAAWGQNNAAVWNEKQEPFKIYGNTYYVGPHGLSSILVTSPQGHILIDGALPESVTQIAANIQSLGFKMKDVKWIVNSHAHFDHGGGISGLQRLSGAKVAASPWSADVVSKSGRGKGDPQFPIIPPIALVPRVQILHDGQTLQVGNMALTAHFTPGHTPGGTSWTWQSCEGTRCLNLVYADSMTAVSADGFRFSDGRSVESFEKSFAFLRGVACDILLTSHPEASGLWERVEKRDLRSPPGACKELAERSSEQLRRRLAAEQQK